MLPDDILLKIFHHYLDASPPLWFTLAHVCRNWRQVVFTSPLGLRLRLYCTYGTPILKILDRLPPFPLVMIYGGFPMFPSPSPTDEDNIMAAFEQADRICSISLTLSGSLLKKFSTISEPLSGLEYLVLRPPNEAELMLPSAFYWGHRLRTLHSTRVAFPSLPQLLSASQDLVDISLHEIPGVEYFPPEAIANALCGMTQLQILSLHFLSLPPRRTYLTLPPPQEDRFVLQALTRLKYRGVSKYFDSLISRLDAPRLRDIDITFFNQPTLDASQLGLFANCTEIQRSPLRADILSSECTISITITHPGTPTWFGLHISCEQLDWQLSSISQICNHFSSFIIRVEDLGIDMSGPSSVPEDMDGDQWLRPIRAFSGAKDFRVVGKLATDILSALRLADEGNETVLPALRHLHVQEPRSMYGPLRDSLAPFVAQRRLSNHPVQVVYSESRYTCQICCVGFGGWEDLVRHMKDQHPNQNMCPYCGVFQWSQTGNDLFQDHLESEHPEVALTDALILNPDSESFLPFLAQ